MSLPTASYNSDIDHKGEVPTTSLEIREQEAAGRRHRRINSRPRKPSSPRAKSGTHSTPPPLRQQLLIHAQKDFQERFGLTLKSSPDTGHNISAMFHPFMQEAHRVLKPNGLLLCKVTDYVHNHRTQWAHLHLIQAGADAGLTPCDCITKIRRGPIIDPRWKTAHHARKHHCYWIVFRNSTKCH